MPQEGSATLPGAVEKAVCLRDLHYRRDSTQVFSGLSLNLPEARIGVIGRNGSGKSQLARLISGLAAPDQGSVTVDGVTVAKDRQAALSCVGILFQNPDHQIIFPTVGEELGFGLTSLGFDKAAVTEQVQAILTRFRRRDWYDRPVHGLSQGQRHLVCLLAVLVMHPKVIVLDEPFAGLDLATTERLGRYLHDLDQRLIHISHDLDALRTYDRVIWIEQGQVVRDGAPGDVLPAYEAEMRQRGARDDFADL